MTTVPVLEFAGVGDVVAFGDLPTGGVGALTVEGWFRVREIGGGNRPLLTKYGATGREWALYLTSDARLYFAVYHAAGVSVGYSAPEVVPLGPWTHLAGCYNGELGGRHVKVWIDGQERTMSSRPAGGGPAVANTAQAAQLGGVLGGESVYPFVGRAGWQRVSNGCRYPGAALRMPDAPPTVDATTAGQWNVSEGAGTTLDNATGNALYDGLIAGALWRASVTDDKRAARPAVAMAFAPVWSRGASAGGWGG